MSNTESESALELRTIGVVGAGLMGTGIVEVAALAGLPTVLVRGSGADPQPVRDKLARALTRRVERGTLDRAAADAALARTTVTGDRDALAGADLVVESIVEDLGEKRALLRDLVRRVGGRTVLASNTSTLRLRDLAGPDYEDRLVGMHFFSPVASMNLVELASLPGTRPDVAEACRRLVARLGKTAVPVIDSPGFVVNRLLVPYLIGAIAAFDQGLAGAGEIDVAMKLGCNHPIGPLALCDLIGLDIVFAMAKLLYKELGDQRYRPPALLRRMVHDGQLGRKSGLGFYDYSASPPRPNQALWELVTGTGAHEAGEIGSAA